MSRGGQSGGWRPQVATTLKERWALESELEVLSYGVLYAARDLVDGSEVSVTAFHPTYFIGGAGRANTEKLQRSREFHHPGIAATLALHLEASTPFVVAQRALGLPLARWRREAGPVGMGTVHRLVGQLLASLAALHAQGYYGALSPATLRVVQGLAWMHNPWTLETPPELPAGELPPPRAVWLAPEQLYDVAPIGAPTDVYGVGLVLGFLLACGLTEPGHSLMVQGIDVPPALDEIYVRATARQAELRYASVQELAGAFEAAFGGEWRASQLALQSSLATGEIPAITDDVIVEGILLPTPPPLPPAEMGVVELADLGGSAIIEAASVERTVEEEGIPAFPGDGADGALPILAPEVVDLNTLETEAVAADADAFVRSQVAASPGDVVEAYVVPPEPAGSPPPLPPGGAGGAPPATPAGAAGGGEAAVTPPGPPPLPPTTPGERRPSDRGTDAEDVHDTSERLALAAGGESWVMDARELSKAVMTGRPLEEIMTRLPDPERSSLLAPPPPRDEAPVAASSDLIAASGLGGVRSDAAMVPRATPVPVPPPRERRAWLWPAALLFLIAGGVAAYALSTGPGDAPVAAEGAVAANGAGVGLAEDAAGVTAEADARGGPGEADAGGAVAAVAAADAEGEDGLSAALAGTVDDQDAGATALGSGEDASGGVEGGDAAGARDDVEELAGVDVEELAGVDVEETPAEDTRRAAVEADTRAEADTAVAFVPTDWKALDCPGGMMKVRRKIKVKLAHGQEADDYQVGCIDRYEYPGGGQMPRVNVSLGEAKSACAAQGKHLCTRSEWRMGCGGKYPYGNTYDPSACNTVGSDGMPRPVLASGSKPACRSGWGTFDMVGNVAEWTSDGFVNGGSAYKHGEAGTCFQASRRSGGHSYVGFRCCAAAK